MGLLAKADCQRLIAESLPKCFGCGYAALWCKEQQQRADNPSCQAGQEQRRTREAFGPVEVVTVSSRARKRPRKQRQRARGIRDDRRYPRVYQRGKGEK